MTLPFAFLVAAGCLQSDPCRTVDAYLRALKAMDAARIESYIDPAYRARRADGSEVPFHPARNRSNRDFERATRTRWKYSILGIDGERITALLSEDNEFYQLLGTGVRTQVTLYAARNGRVYFTENFALVDERGTYSTAVSAFTAWLKQQPAALSDPDILGEGNLVFSTASGPKLVGWLKEYRKVRTDRP